ncbi:MAG: hypothetical protein NTV94_19470, partial [Planctomycetota bacterium]|nr:hypothetical protein [Planctomycetota bacterium]
SQRSLARKVQTRAALGLPERRVQIMTGHQAGMWHAGILAKYIFSHLLSEEIQDGAWSHVVVDQDVNDAGLLTAPTLEAQRLAIRVAPQNATVISGRQAPATTLPKLPDNLSPQVRLALGHTFDLLDEHRSEPSLAAQWARVVERAMTPYAPRGKMVFATALARTPGFEELLAAICRDPHACVQHYNQAAAAVPHARVAPLTMHEGSVELPLWRIDPTTGIRRPAFSADLDHTDPSLLAPRALLLTAFMRLFVCDLFVHGMGGGRYDTITDAWIKAWMPDWVLAPTCVVSATLYLPMAQSQLLPTPEQIAQAHWLAHRAQHDPSLLDDTTAAAAKQALLTQLEQARGNRFLRATLYRQLHDLLAHMRTSHQAQLDGLAHDAAKLDGSAELSGVVFDRTWPFALHSAEALGGLSRAIRSAISGH